MWNFCTWPVVFFFYIWNVIWLSTRLFMATYLYVKDRRMCVSSALVVYCFKVMQCEVMHGHTPSCKVMQRHARSWKVMQGKVESHSILVNFTLLLRSFDCIQAFLGNWREMVVYHRWSPKFRLSFLCCFFWKQSLFAGHFTNPISLSISFAQLVNAKGA